MPTYADALGNARGVPRIGETAAVLTRLRIHDVDRKTTYLVKPCGESDSPLNLSRFDWRLTSESVEAPIRLCPERNEDLWMRVPFKDGR